MPCRFLALPQLRQSLGWEHEGTRQLIASELLARTAKHVLACRLRHSRESTGFEDEVMRDGMS